MYDPDGLTLPEKLRTSLLECTAIIATAQFFRAREMWADVSERLERLAIVSTDTARLARAMQSQAWDTL